MTIFIRSCVVSVLAMVLTIPSLSADVYSVDQVVAVVNSDVILQSELDQRMQEMISEWRAVGQPLPPLARIREVMLEQLILESIQQQLAVRLGLRIDDAELNRAMESIAEQNRMDLAQFQAAVAAQGLSYANMRERTRRDLLLRRIQQGHINSRIRVTEQAITQFLNSKASQALTPADYRVEHALIIVPSTATADEVAAADQRAQQLYQTISDGESFIEVMEESNIPTSDLGWRSKEDLPSLLVDIIPTLSVGETAPPIRSASGFHLVQLADKRSDQAVITQTKARHILLKPSAIRDDQTARAEIEALREEAIEQDNFLALAREYSEDIGSSLEGGDLGWVSPGQMVPEFERAMDNTMVGSISLPARSEYGWHIVLVEDRREKDITDDLRYQLARQAIHQREYQDELEAWLQQIRDEAYIDIKQGDNDNETMQSNNDL